MKTKQPKRKPANKLLLPDASHKYISLSEKTEVYSTPPHHGLSLRLNYNQHLPSFLAQHYRKGPSAGSQGTSFRIQISGSQGNVGDVTSSLCFPFSPSFLFKSKKCPLSCLPCTKELPDMNRIQLIMKICQCYRLKSMMFRQINLKKSLTQAQHEF